MIEEETAVRNWLEAVEAPPPRLDLDEIVQIGRTQVRRRRQLAAGGSAAVALAVAAAVPVALRAWPAGDPYVAADRYPTLDCTITELSLPDGDIDLDHVEVAAMDPTGQYVVGNQSNGDVQYAGPGLIERVEGAVILWDNGEPAELTELRGAAQAVDVNSSGVVVGIGWDDLDGGWVYRDGDLAELPEPPGFSVNRVRGLNEVGDVVGMVVPEGSRDEEFVNESVAVWPAADRDQPRILHEPSGKDVAEVAGITDTGAVVGWLHGEPGVPSRFLPYAWEPDGTGHYLPLPDGAVGGQVHDVAGEWAAGSADVLVPQESVREPSPASPTAEPVSPSPGAVDPSPNADGQVLVTLPARWNLRTGTAEVLDTGVPPEAGSATSANAVAANGDLVVGLSDAPRVLRDGEWYSLPGSDDTPALVAMSEDGTAIAGSLGFAAWAWDARSSAPTPSPANSIVQVVWHC